MDEILGGMHSTVQGASRRREESHHLYARESIRLSGIQWLNSNNAPAIKIDRADHLLTESWGRGKDATKYREKQAEYLRVEDHRAAWMMEVKFLNEKFGSKYFEHVAQAEKRLLELDKKGSVQLESRFKQEIQERQAILGDMAFAREQKSSKQLKAHQDELTKSYQRSLKDKLQRVNSVNDAKAKALDSAARARKHAADAKRFRTESGRVRLKLRWEQQGAVRLKGVTQNIESKERLRAAVKTNLGKHSVALSKESIRSWRAEHKRVLKLTESKAERTQISKQHLAERKVLRKTLKLETRKLGSLESSLDDNLSDKRSRGLS